jgi:uncharacterized protein with HEPN domain
VRRSDGERLSDAQRFIIGIGQIVSEAGGAPARDSIAYFAVLHHLTVLAEAPHQIGQEVQNLSPEIPWAGIWATRNFIVHAYWQVDAAVVAEILNDRLATLRAQVDSLAALVA